ncbi:MAG: hypothetical protein IJR28_02485 [Ottowia sp.]|nr:hypothetical protein [Ottowia sp.]
MSNRRISQIPFSLILPFFFFVAFTLVFLNVAWVADDAFITFRSVDNLLKGCGPVWNVGERVQAYTHPLWYALLIIGIGLFKHHYWVAIALSYGCLMATAFLLLKIAKAGQSFAQAVIALFVLLLSRAFMDYSSSGLENPLLHLLLAGYVLIAIKQQDAVKRFLHTSLLYSLVFLTRPDGIFIITPASLWMLWQAKQQSGWKRTLKLAAIAAAPAVAWEAFSLIYYGSLVPNTALAKVNIDYPRAVLLEQAKNYFAFNLQKDPITLGMVLLSFALVWLNKNALPKLLVTGVALQMLYICYVGADYMLGRFLSPSVAVAAMAFMLLKNIPYMPAVGGVLLFLFHLWTDDCNLKYSPGFQSVEVSEAGLSDERGFYYQSTGLVPVIAKHGGNAYTHAFGGAYAFRRNAGTPNIGIVRAAGFGPWMAGEKSYWIDLFALGEPFLARLPARTGARVGHYERAFPDGYLETLITGKNVIVDSTLAALYDDVALAVRGDIWSKARWSAIWRLNLGYYNGLGKNFDRDSRTPWRVIIHPEWRHSEYDDFDVEMGDAFSGRALGAGFPLAVPPAFSPFSQER